ncbi:MAG: carboxypeptidase regulatory-like domain-containing protein [Sphingobacteriales bacterium]|nr:MAG: carboxypeptidase regulatory-like domain-containing protein [Sphingobacteriales bacterium]
MKITTLLLTSLMFMGCSKDTEKISGDEKWPEQPPLAAVTGQQTFNVDANIHHVNVMPENPRMPKFPSVSVKQGFARGYVADLSGKPLEGANIGVVSSLTGTLHASAVGQTDQNGYYEFKLPAGAAYFFGTAIAISYGQTNVVMALSPDQGTAYFPSGKGVVKNFVLTSHGTADPAQVNQSPSFSTNYYGGSLYLNYSLNYEGESYPGYVPVGGVIEIELIPEGTGLFGESRSFKVNKTVGLNLGFNIVNIPVGKYTIKAKLRGGGELKMSENGPKKHLYPNLGLKPDGAIATSSVLFTPVYQITPEMVGSYKSNWEALSIRLQTQ